MGENVKKCDTPYCNNQVSFCKKDFVFCSECKSKHSSNVLKLQVEYGKPIVDVLLEACLFDTAGGMADYLGVSFMSIYNWIKQYFGMTFQDFKRAYICKSEKCYLLEVKRSNYTRSEYILKKIRSLGGCACNNSVDSDFIMTNCPVHKLSGILRGCPKIKKISDKLFALSPNPIKIKHLFPKFFKELKKE
ncbi:MAG: hypothetical protein MUF50_04730 [Planctomycetes bacterium]|nr:hypothetical protein [Planctomycetota bacterium]